MSIIFAKPSKEEGGEAKGGGIALFEMTHNLEKNILSFYDTCRN